MAVFNDGVIEATLSSELLTTNQQNFIGWSVTAPATIISNVARIYSVAGEWSAVQLAGVLVTGKIYKVSFTVTGSPVGTMRVGAGFVVTPVAGQNTMYYDPSKYSDGTNLSLTRNSVVSGCNISITSISLIEVQNYNTLDYTDGNKNIPMFEYPSTNLLQNPNNFNAASWTGTGIVKSADGSTVTFLGQVYILQELSGLVAGTTYNISWTARATEAGKGIQFSYETNTTGGSNAFYKYTVLGLTDHTFNFTFTYGTGGTYGKVLLYQFSGDNLPSNRVTVCVSNVSLTVAQSETSIGGSSNNLTVEPNTSTVDSSNGSNPHDNIQRECATTNMVFNPEFTSGLSGYTSSQWPVGVFDPADGVSYDASMQCLKIQKRVGTNNQTFATTTVTGLTPYSTYMFSADVLCSNGYACIDTQAGGLSIGPWTTTFCNGAMSGTWQRISCAVTLGNITLLGLIIGVYTAFTSDAWFRQVQFYPVTTETTVAIGPESASILEDAQVNLLNNPSMLTTTGWSIAGGTQIAYPYSPLGSFPADMTGCLQITGDVSNWMASSQQNNLNLSTQYTYSAWVFIPSSVGAGLVSLQTWYISGGWNMISQLNIPEMDQWVQKSITFTTNSISAAHVTSVIFASGNGKSIYIANSRLETLQYESESESAWSANSLIAENTGSNIVGGNMLTGAGYSSSGTDATHIITYGYGGGIRVQGDTTTPVLSLITPAPTTRGAWYDVTVVYTGTPSCMKYDCLINGLPSSIGLANSGVTQRMQAWGAAFIMYRNMANLDTTITSISVVPVASDTYSYSTSDVASNTQVIPFTRSSTAFDTMGNLTQINQPRFTNRVLKADGSYSQALLIEDATVNQLTSTDFQTWVPYITGGATGTITYRNDPVYGKVVTLTKTDNGVGRFGISKGITGMSGSLYTRSMRVRALSTTGSVAPGYVDCQANAGWIFANLITIGNIPALSSYPLNTWYQQVNSINNTPDTLSGNGAAYIWVDSTSGSCEFALPQIELKPYATSFINGSRSVDLFKSTTLPLNPINGTVEFWWNCQQPSNTIVSQATSPKLLQIGEYYQNSSLSFWCFSSGATPSLMLDVKGQVNSVWSTSQTVRPAGWYTPNTWYHMAVKWVNGTTFTAYVNGVPYGPYVIADAMTSFSGNLFDISHYTSGGAINSLYSNVRISNVARSDAEILAAYNNPTVDPVCDANTIALYKFDDIPRALENLIVSGSVLSSATESDPMIETLDVREMGYSDSTEIVSSIESNVGDKPTFNNITEIATKNYVSNPTPFVNGTNWGSTVDSAHGYVLNITRVFDVVTQQWVIDFNSTTLGTGGWIVAGYNLSADLPVTKFDTSSQYRISFDAAYVSGGQYLAWSVRDSSGQNAIIPFQYATLNPTYTTYSLVFTPSVSGNIPWLYMINAAFTPSSSPALGEFRVTNVKLERIDAFETSSVAITTVAQVDEALTAIETMLVTEVGVASLQETVTSIATIIAGNVTSSAISEIIFTTDTSLRFRYVDGQMIEVLSSGDSATVPYIITGAVITELANAKFRSVVISLQRIPHVSRISFTNGRVVTENFKTDNIASVVFPRDEDTIISEI